MKIFKSDKAEQDLLQIYRYFAERNPQSAGALVEEMSTKFKNLSRFRLLDANDQVWRSVFAVSW